MDAPTRKLISGLHLAIRQEDLAGAADLIASGIDVDPKGLPRKATPLGVAADLGMLDIALALLAAGADPCAQRKIELTPLMEEARQANPALVGALARASANLDFGAGGQYGAALRQAVIFGPAANVEILLRPGADVDATNLSLQTPLPPTRPRPATAKPRI